MDYTEGLVLLCATVLPVLLVALAGAASPLESARAEIALTLDGAHDSIGVPTGTAGATSIDGAVAATLYLRPVTDEARPIALQPFLQRAGSLHFAATVGDLGASPLGGLRTGASLGGDLFVHRAVSIAFEGGYRFLDGVAPGASSSYVPLSLGLGLWWGDVRLGLGADGVWSSRDGFGGDSVRGRLDLRAVFVEHIELSTGAAANAHSIDAYLRAAYYPSKHLGLLGGGWGGGTSGATRFPDVTDTEAQLGHAPFDLRAIEARPAADQAHFGCFVGFSYWATPRLGAIVHYDVTWISADGVGATDQRAVLTIAARGL